MMPQTEADFQLALEREKLAALAEFAAGAGHEINNPLTVISGRAQLLLQEETDPERRHALALIIAQAKRVHEMIADMMLFARPPRPEIKSFDICKLIDELLVELGPRCARQDTALIIRQFDNGRSGASAGLSSNTPGGTAGLSSSTPGGTAGLSSSVENTGGQATRGTHNTIHNGPQVRTGNSEPIMIEADAAQIAAAIRAVCLNAIEALQSGGRIEIALDNVGDEVRVSISDTGPGIKPEERRHLFDPFYSARQAGRGLGLGLSKAWRIITNHGGRIEVDNAPAGGARFMVSLKRRNET